MVHGEEHAEQVDEDPEQVQDVVTERTLVTFAMNLVQNLIYMICKYIHIYIIQSSWSIPNLYQGYFGSVPNLNLTRRQTDQGYFGSVPNLNLLGPYQT